MNYVAVALLSVLLGGAVHFIYRWRLGLRNHAPLKHFAALVALTLSFILWAACTTRVFPVNNVFLLSSGLVAIIPNMVWMFRRRRSTVPDHDDRPHHV